MSTNEYIFDCKNVVGLRGKLNSMWKNLKSAIIIVAWILLGMIWLLSIGFPVTNISQGEIWTTSNLASFLLASALSFILVKKWVVIFPGLLLYGIFHFIVLLVTGRKPGSWSELEMLYTVALATVGIYVFIKFQHIDLDVLDRILLTGFSVFLFVPIGLGWSASVWTIALAVPIAAVSLRHLRLKGGRVAWCRSPRFGSKAD